MLRLIAVLCAIIATGGCVTSRGQVRTNASAPAETRAQKTEATLDSYWRTTRLDTTSLSSLSDFTAQFGEAGARTMLKVASDSSAPLVKRQYALWGLAYYWGRWNCQAPPWVNNWPLVRPGTCTYDSLKDSASALSVPDSAAPLSTPLRQVSISSRMRDSIRSVLAGISAAQNGAGEAARQLLATHVASEETFGYVAGTCRQSAEATVVAERFMERIATGQHQMWQLARCNVSGRTVLTTVWPRADTDTASLVALMMITAAIRDVEVARTLQRVARDSGLPDTTRYAAIVALGTYLHAAFTPLAVQLVRSRGRTLPHCRIPKRGERFFSQLNGPRPFSTRDTEQLSDELKAMASELETAELRVLAAAVADCAAQLIVRLPQHEPYPWIDVTSYTAPALVDTPTSEDLADRHCETFRQDLMQEADVARARTAMQTVGHCPEAGPALLAERWRTPLTNPELRSELQRVSGGLLDRRIFDALCDVVANETNTFEVRSWALAGLFSYVQRGVYTPVRERYPRNEITISGGIHSHWSQSYGASVVDRSAERVREFIQLLIGRGDRDPEFLALMKRTFRSS